MLALNPGDTFQKDFRVLRPLTEGGMGTLYVVEQISTGKKRALKLMSKTTGDDEEARRRFAQEARVGSLIESEHIVEVIAAGVDEESNRPWLIMELLEGEDLGHVLERGAPLPPMFVHDLFKQLCHALGAAHDLPVVHRDLKPDNIFLARSRVAHTKFLVKLLDFGIAKVLLDGTNSTGSVGTPLWMAPEQGRPNTPITPATDVWALGLIAFILLTGKCYWLEGNSDTGGDVMALMHEVFFDPLPQAMARAVELGARPTPPGFDEWFAKCVVRDINARFPNARAAWKELEPILLAIDDDLDAGEFTLNVRSRVTTTGSAKVPSSRPPPPDAFAPTSADAAPPPTSKPASSRTGGPVSITPPPNRARSLGLPIAAAAAAVVLGVGAYLGLRTPPSDATPAASATTITQAAIDAGAAPTSDPIASTTATATESATPSATASVTATARASATATGKPTATTTATSATAATTATGAVKPPPTSSNPLNMTLQ